MTHNVDTPHKEFDSSLYVEFDLPARQVALQWLRSRGHHAIENPDVYGIDILLPKEGRGVEVEVKTVWKDGTKPFPFSEVNFLARKKKLFEGNGNVFVMFSADLRGCLVINTSLLQEFLTEKPHKLTVKVGAETFEDYFYKIPLSAFRIHRIDV